MTTALFFNTLCEICADSRTCDIVHDMNWMLNEYEWRRVRSLLYW